MSNIKKQLVTIEKWVGDTKSWYWIVGSDGEGIDGFSKKYQAQAYIECSGKTQKNLLNVFEEVAKAHFGKKKKIKIIDPIKFEKSSKKDCLIC